MSVSSSSRSSSSNRPIGKLFHLVFCCCCFIVINVFMRTETAFNQQSLKAIQLQSHPAIHVAFFFLIGLIFLPMGVYFINQATLVSEFKYPYDGPDTTTSCSISTGNEGRSCNVKLSNYFFVFQLNNVCTPIVFVFLSFLFSFFF